jgi:hypothetical protein
MTIVNDILRQMPGLGRPQRKFLATLLVTILVLRGRVNFRNLSRYCDDSERTIARQFREPFDWPAFQPTVSLGVTSVVAYTYGCDDGRIEPIRCASIDGALGDRCSQHRACSRPPAGARLAHSALAAGSRPGSTADPGGLHRSSTRPRSGSRPCADASPARCAPATHPSLSHPDLV